LLEIDIVAHSFVITPLELLNHLNVEHCHNGPDQHLDTLRLLREQKRPILQHNEGDIDCINGRSNRIGDDPPNGRWGIYEVFFNRIGNQLTLVMLEELE
jgi:hypothetical protein